MRTYKGLLIRVQKKANGARAKVNALFHVFYIGLY